MSEFQMGTRPFVSILVLFHNLEDCVDHCLDTLLAQSYDNYEVVCVNDGSTDRTREKLAAYELCQNIRVIDLENGGVSRARNAAIEHAQGEFVTFVDGDDVVSPRYLEFLVRALVESGAEQAIGKYCVVLTRNGVPVPDSWSDRFSYRTLDREQMAHSFLYGETIISPWCHVAKRQLYIDNPFPEGKVYEDTLTFEGQVLSCDSFAFVDVPLYGYVKRWESITKPSIADSGQIANFGEAITALGEGVRRQTIAQEAGLVYRTALEYSRLYRLAYRIRGDETADYWRAKALSYVKDHLKELRADKEVPKSDRLRFRVLCMFPAHFDQIFSKYEEAAFKRETN